MCRQTAQLRYQECVFQARTHNCYGHVHRNPLPLCRVHAVNRLCVLLCVGNISTLLINMLELWVHPLLSSHVIVMRCHLKTITQDKR